LSPTLVQTSDPPRNRLLAALPADDWARWQARLELVELRRGQVLCEPGSTPAHLVFPTTAIVSLLYTMQDGDSAEFAVVGNDGVVGVSLFMGGQATPWRAVVQSAGQALRLGTDALADSGRAGGSALRLLLRYAQALIAQVAQTALCNRYHSIDQQLSRRLLLGLDRSTSDELLMTQEGISHLLGVRREGVTAAAQKLLQAGVIRYHRGRIAVLDRARLEEHSCECYAAARREQERLLAPVG
jgi:CRP-like cAMP-binding protein